MSIFYDGSFLLFPKITILLNACEVFFFQILIDLKVRWVHFQFTCIETLRKKNVTSHFLFHCAVGLRFLVVGAGARTRKFSNLPEVASIAEDSRIHFFRLTAAVPTDGSHAITVRIVNSLTMRRERCDGFTTRVRFADTIGVVHRRALDWWVSWVWCRCRSKLLGWTAAIGADTGHVIPEKLVCPLAKVRGGPG